MTVTMHKEKKINKIIIIIIIIIIIVIIMIMMIMMIIIIIKRYENNSVDGKHFFFTFSRRKVNYIFKFTQISVGGAELEKMDILYFFSIL